MGAAEVSLETLVPNTANDKWLALKTEGGGGGGGGGGGAKQGNVALLHATVSCAPKRRSLSLRRHAPLLASRNKPETRSPTFEPAALDSFIPKKQLQKLSPTERQQQTAVMEFIETERSYLRDLDVLSRVCPSPIVVVTY